MLKRIMRNNVEYIAIQMNNKEYLLSINSKIKIMSLFSGIGLYYKFQNLIDCHFNGCIECNLTLIITDAISKEVDAVTELGISKIEANLVINEINTRLNTKYPNF